MRRPGMHLLLAVCCTPVLLAAVRPAAFAQTSSGTIAGVVRDASERVLPGATVRAVNEATAVERQTVTNAVGGFDLPILPPGTYRIEAELSGFKKAVRAGLALQVNQRAEVNFVLDVGDVTEEVVVRGEAPLLDTQSATIGTVVVHRHFTALPLNGRDFFQLSTLVPGLQSAVEGSQNATQGGAVSVNGAREQTNNFLLDGVDNNDLAINQIVVPPSLDAIEQFKIQSSTYSAEFGRSGGGQFNYVTKSGTNILRGSAYEFLRNSALDSRNYFHPREGDIPRFERHQFGGSLGGPMRRDRTFFFANYEGLRNEQAFPRVATVPPLAWINGNFSSLLTGRIDPATGFDAGQLFDPRTGLPIPGNVIPAALRDPAGAAILRYYPAPDDPAAAGPSAATVAPVGTNQIDQFIVRLDHALGTSGQLFTRYGFWREDRFNPFDPLVDPTNVPGFGTFTKNLGQNLAVGWTRTFRGRLVHDFRFGYNRLQGGIFQEHQGNDIAGSLGITGLLTDPKDTGRPGVILGITDALIEPTNTPQDRWDSTFQFVDSLSWLVGRHSLKTGVDVKYFRLDGYLDIIARGQFIFAGLSGNPVADLLLGAPVVALRQNPATNTDQAMRNTSVYTYFQDDWTVSDDLTLNLGLRYEYNQPPYEAKNRMSVPNLDGRWNGDFIQVGTQGIPRAGYPADTNNIAPRAGFAWKPGGSTRTVIRGGFGVYYDTGIQNLNLNLRLNPPYYSLDLAPAPESLRNAFSGDAVPITLPSTMAQNYVDGMYRQWSLGVQQELAPNLVLDVAYVGSTGENLQQGIDANQGPAGGPPVRNPDFGPTFGSGLARSDYRALQVRLERRLAGGLSFLGAYTWSRSRDTSSALFGNIKIYAPQNSNDLDGDYGPSDFDTPHRLVVSWVWEVPYGAGRRFGDGGGALAGTFGNWDVAGIGTFQSGRPFTVYYGVAANYSGTSNGANGGAGLDRPNLVGTPTVSSPSAERWFNPDAFAPPVNTFGNVGRNTLRGDRFSTIDLAALKNIALGSRSRLQIRVEVFNLLNTTNFFLPVSDLTNERAGSIVRAYDARQVQLGIRLTF